MADDLVSRNSIAFTNLGGLSNHECTRINTNLAHLIGVHWCSFVVKSSVAAEPRRIIPSRLASGFSVLDELCLSWDF